MISSSSPIRILVVDDHPVVRDGLASLIERQTDMLLVGEAETGREAITLTQSLSPSIVLLDLKLPDTNGIRVLEELQRLCPGTGVVVLTTYEGDVQARRALKAGARGYLLKASLRRELGVCIRVVASGQRHIQQEVALDVALHINDPDLTTRELSVLDMIARGSSNKVAADRLQLSEETVKSHVASILAKLGARDRTHAVTIALERGFFEL